MCNLAVNEVKHHECCVLLYSEIELQKVKLNVVCYIYSSGLHRAILKRSE